MSEIGNVTSDIAGEKFYAAQAQRAKEQATQKQLIAQDPSNTTGVQWAQAKAPVQAQATQQAGNAAKPVNDKNVKGSANFEIVQPNIEDVALLSTTVSIQDKAVEAPRQNPVTSFVADRINMGALVESYKECFKKSKSHNLLLERFMSNVKFSSLKTLLSLLGLSADEQIKMQSEVREKTLSEIDSKLKNDWAYTKAMLEITTNS